MSLACPCKHYEGHPTLRVLHLNAERGRHSHLQWEKSAQQQKERSAAGELAEAPPDGWCSMTRLLGRDRRLPASPAVRSRDAMDAACPTHIVWIGFLRYCSSAAIHFCNASYGAEKTSGTLQGGPCSPAWYHTPPCPQ